MKLVIQLQTPCSWEDLFTFVEIINEYLSDFEVENVFVTTTNCIGVRLRKE